MPKELPVPEDLLNDTDAVELARLWIGLGDLHVKLNVGMYGDADGAGETTAWGDILADTIRHLGRAIALQSGADESDSVNQITSRLMESLNCSERPMDGEFD